MISVETPNGNPFRLLHTINQLKNKRSFLFFISALKIAWAKVVVIEKLEKAALKARPREVKKGDTSQILKKGITLINIANTIRDIEKIEKKTMKDLNQIKSTKKQNFINIKLVGEFYVALEPFVNHNIEEKLGYLGVEVERGVSIQPWIVSLLKFLKSTDTQEDIIEKAAKPYLAQSVGGEGQPTIGNIVLASKKGMDGAVHVIPFTCMPEIVAETICKRVSEDLNFPVLTIVYDEQTGEEGLNTRLEAFVDLLKSKKMQKNLNHINLTH